MSENLKKVSQQDSEVTFLNLETNTKENLKMVLNKEKEIISIKTVMFIRENGNQD